MRVFCDLDGTLLDVAPRHYRVYEQVTSALGGRPLERDVYWRLKRDKVKWAELLAKSGLTPEDERRFLDRFIQLIEQPASLREDRLFAGTPAALDALARGGHEAYLVSLRRNGEQLRAQVAALGLGPAFVEVLSGHSESDGHDVKIALIAPHAQEGGLIVGDTEADIIAGQRLGLTTVAVKSGIRSERFLAALAPDHLLESIADLPGVLSRLGA